MSLVPKSLGFITVSSPGTSVPLTTTNTPCKVLRLEPRQNATTANVGNIYIGGKALSKNTPSTIYAVLSPEQVDGIEITGGQGGYFEDLALWNIDADNASDGVLAGYQV